MDLQPQGTWYVDEPLAVVGMDNETPAEGDMDNDPPAAKEEDDGTLAKDGLMNLQRRGAQITDLQQWGTWWLNLHGWGA